VLRKDLLRGCPELLCSGPKLLRQAGLRGVVRLRQTVVLRRGPELLRQAGLRGIVRLCQQLRLREQLRLLELRMLLPPHRPVLRFAPLRLRLLREELRMRRSLVLCGCPKLLRRGPKLLRQAVVLCSPELLCEAG
jgi:hypothetical protein